MKAAIYIIAVIVLCLVLAAGVIALIGSQLPRNHVATRSLFLKQSPESVYAVARDFASAPTWRSDVKRIDLKNQPDGRIRFREEGKNGTVNYELTEDVPGRRLVTQILDTDLGYSGSWIYAFAAENGGTRVTITEEGEVSNVIFRFMSRYIFGQTASIDQYLISLGKRFGESTSPQ